jgi:hypothetical protein
MGEFGQESTTEREKENGQNRRQNHRIATFGKQITQQTNNLKHFYEFCFEAITVSQARSIRKTLTLRVHIMMNIQ